MVVGPPGVRVLHGLVATVAFFFCNFSTLEAVLLDILLDLGSRIVATALVVPVHVSSKYVRLKDPTFHLNGDAPHIRFDLAYTSNLKSITKLFHNPVLFQQLQTTAIRPAMRRVLPSYVLEERRLNEEDNAHHIKTTSCAICWESCGDVDFCSSPPHHLPCGHGFHLSCIREWMKRDATCPLCRRALPSVQDTFEIDHVATTLIPSNSRLSRGEMVVVLKRRRSEVDSNMGGFPIRCTVDGHVLSMLQWRRLGLRWFKVLLDDWLREYVLQIVAFALCYKSLLWGVTYIAT
ncbi:hypothetical protein DYB25_002816 [Aphanomyces astaci]|uniref:RING-type domain-containing protein n=1 Tax=Aphanomyces astaci TaxID=112090 RepID=A0A397DAQ5_APHAT|nr:hypothetical protein DYB36_000407 [Aphanomyces astaci]RHY13807.1 hypothetical protein DYB25_002816 [Aphanomyces astaci]RHY37771.1 hypothetical protein DYB34_003550 [Aphanomyces astaci]RHY58625.1 hypothetical protein DYB38_004648 [Aphanomyces astaci]RHY59950.1 hypothetical protein DYB30_000575 [Aphanomyces astaci]